VADGARRDGAEVTLVIPAYRAASTLGDVLERVRRAAPDAAVLVVDDGSDDATAAVGRAGGAVVICHPANLGKGRALATGLAAAKTRGARQVVTMDADGQHPPEAIPKLLAPVLAGSADLVVGARRREPGAMPLGRRATNWLSSVLVSRAEFQRLPEDRNLPPVLASPFHAWR
jgi:glycosyltransferase involved in cell wall biosynthesis